MEPLLVKLKHEVFGRPCDVPLYGVNARARFDLVETGKINAVHHSMAAQQKVLLFDQFGRRNGRLRRQKTKVDAYSDDGQSMLAV